MTLLQELSVLQPEPVEAAFDGAFDKCTSFEETGVMVDALVDGFPALARLVERLRDRLVEEVDEEHDRAMIVLGGVLVLVGLVECAQAQSLKLQFPDVPDAPKL